jgi:transcriptional regulator with XRE-family HTH domain
MSQDKEEVKRLLEVIRTLMRMLGVSNREVERRLKLHPSSLTRLFNGQVEAKVEVVLGIARAIGLEYSELFNFAYPERDAGDPSDSAKRILSLLSGLQPSTKSRRAQSAAKEPEELKGMLQELLTALRTTPAKTGGE